MTDVTVPPVVRELVVAAPLDTCFKTFVEGFGTWWPPEHHIGDRTVVDFLIEPVVGGRCYDVDTDGAECHWGTVLAIEPPHRLVVAWHIQGDWTIDHDPTRQSEVEVTFTPLDPGRTALRLEHGHLERHGDGADGIRHGVGGDGGWTVLVARFADVAEGRPPRPLPTAAAATPITDDDMRALLPTSRPYTAVLLHAGAAYGTPGADAVIWEHGRRNFELRAQGTLAIVCPVTDGTGLCGIGIFDGAPDEIAALMDDDPGVRAGVFTYEVHPVRSFPGDALPAVAPAPGPGDAGTTTGAGGRTRPPTPDSP
jgi:uncharacterized protein YndB with AHSA1/START domain